MSLPAQTPLCQWLVPGCLKDAAAQLSAWNEPQAGGLQIDLFGEAGSDTDITICLRSPLWGEFGRLRLTYVDRGQTLLCLYRPPYPTPAETEAYEAQIRSVLPKPAIALSLLDMYGPEKSLPYLAARLHERRMACLDMVRISLAHHFRGAAIAPISTNEPGPQTPMSPESENLSDPPNIPTARMHPKRDISRTNKSDSRLLELWSDGQSVKQIASQTDKTEKTILNRLSLLRQTLGEQVVPRRR